MLIQLTFATVMVVVTLLIHSAGITALVLGLRVKLEAGEEDHHFCLNRAVVMLIAVLALFTLHGIEIRLCAALFLLIGVFPALEAAAYFSTITYASIGFGNAEMARSRRVVGVIEGINGVFLLGWSTTFFVTVVARMRK